MLQTANELPLAPRAFSSATNARSVRSGFSANRTVIQRRWASSTNGRVPPIGFASGLPVSRARLAQRSADDSPMLKCCAAFCPLMPAVIAVTTRSRRSRE